MERPRTRAVPFLSSARNNPLIGLIVPVFAGIVAFVISLAGTATLTRILAHSLDAIATWAVIDIVVSLTFAFPCVLCRMVRLA